HPPRRPPVPTRRSSDLDDHLEHHLLDSPRERPVRSAIGVGVLTFYIVLVVAGAQDIIAQKLGVGIPAVTNTLRVVIFVLPALARSEEHTSELQSPYDLV